MKLKILHFPNVTYTTKIVTIIQAVRKRSPKEIKGNELRHVLYHTILSGIIILTNFVWQEISFFGITKIGLQQKIIPIYKCLIKCNSQYFHLVFQTKTYMKKYC